MLERLKMSTLKKLCRPMLALGLALTVGGFFAVGCVDNSGNKTYPRGDSGAAEGGDDVAVSDDATTPARTRPPRTRRLRTRRHPTDRLAMEPSGDVSVPTRRRRRPRRSARRRRRRLRRGHSTIGAPLAAPPSRRAPAVAAGCPAAFAAAGAGSVA